MISKDMIRAGYNLGIIRLIDSPAEDGTVCQIGEHWFYFGGQTAEEMTSDEYKKSIPEDTIIDEIYEVLREFSNDDGFKDEYGYYESYLEEQIDSKDTILWNLLRDHIGHHVEIVYYGDSANPADICLECTDCNDVILDAEIYTICAREDI